MSQFLKIISNVGGRSHVQPSVPQVGLAAFGKHPGWDDHIPGIGVGTDALAQLKQTLYVSGIGGQIDAGAWEKLEADKRIEGFDHDFLAAWGKHILSGRFWSSIDRKGRTKYPMFLCLDGQNVPVDLILQLNQEELSVLQERCLAAKEQEAVQLECATSQDRVKARVQSAKSAMEGESSAAIDWEKFLAAPQLGVGQIGLLRVLHEIRYLALTSAPAPVRSKEISSLQLRVPVISGAAQEPLLPWFEFFRCLLPQGTPLCLIQRRNADWVEVIIGEPTTRELFCLQASLVAMPLVTEIPYELAPELTKVLPDVISTLTRPKTQTTPPTTIVASAVAPVSPEKKISQNIWLWVTVAAVFLILILFVFLKSCASHHPVEPVEKAKNITKESAVLNSGTIADKSSAVSKIAGGGEVSPVAAPAPPVSDPNAGFRSSLTAASIAMIHRDYPAAIEQAQIALASNSTSKEARDILDKATRAEEEIKLGSERDAKYTNQINLARSELKSLRFDEASQSAKTALEVRPDSSEASDLLALAKREQARLLAQRELEQKYFNSMTMAKVALEKKNYSEAMAQARTALQFKPDDAGAARIVTLAGDAVAVEKALMLQTNNFLAAVRAGQTALSKGDVAGAVAQSHAAATIDPQNPQLAELNARIKRSQDVAQARAALQQRDLPALAKWGAAYPQDSEIQALIAQSKEDGCESLTVQAEVMMVRFGTKKPKEVHSEAARKTERIAGQLLRPEIERNLQLVDTLKTKFKTAGCLTKDLEKELDRVKDNINSL